MSHSGDGVHEHAHRQHDDHQHDDDHSDEHVPGQGHGHGHGHGHSHDPADLLDDLAATTSAGIRAVVVGLVGLLVTALIQLALVTVTGSVALLSDTVHNLGDCLTALPIWLAFRLARRPPSPRFTYGLGRVEDLSGLAVVAAIGLSGVFALAESIDRLRHPSLVSQPWVVVAAGLVGMVGNELVARYRIGVGRRIGSLALVADGEHARTDGLTSLAVVASGLASLAGWGWADPVVGLLIAGLIARLFVATSKPVVARLLDAADPELTDQVYAAAASTPGVLAVSSVQVRWLGHRPRAELAVSVDPSLTVRSAAQIAEAVTVELLAHTRVRVAAVRAVPGSGTGPAAAYPEGPGR